MALQDVVSDAEAKALVVVKKAAGDLSQIVVDELPALLDVAAAAIPGQIDDMVIAALKPALIAAAQSLVDKLKA